MRTLATRQKHQTALGKFLKFVQKRMRPLVEDVESDVVLVAYSNDCSVQGVQHHNGSQLLAAMMDPWLSSSRFGPRKLPRFHRCLKVWRKAYLRAPDEQCTHQYGKALQHNSSLSIILMWH